MASSSAGTAAPPSRAPTLPRSRRCADRNAIKVLLTANFIKVAIAGGNTRGGRKAAQYTLLSRPPILKSTLARPSV